MYQGKTLNLTTLYPGQQFNVFILRLGVEKEEKEENVGIINIQKDEEEVILRDKRAIRGTVIKEGGEEESKQEEVCDCVFPAAVLLIW